MSLGDMSPLRIVVLSLRQQRQGGIAVCSTLNWLRNESMFRLDYYITVMSIYLVAFNNGWDSFFAYTKLADAEEFARHLVLTDRLIVNNVDNETMHRLQLMNFQQIKDFLQDDFDHLSVDVQRLPLHTCNWEELGRLRPGDLAGREVP
jgi:hypothetical protein